MMLGRSWLSLRVDHPADRSRVHFAPGDTIRGVCSIHGEPVPQLIKVSLTGRCTTITLELSHVDKEGIEHGKKDRKVTKTITFLNTSEISQVRAPPDPGMLSGTLYKDEESETDSIDEKHAEKAGFESSQLEQGSGDDGQQVIEFPFALQIPTRTIGSKHENWLLKPLPATRKATQGNGKIEYKLKVSAHHPPRILGGLLSAVKGDETEIVIVPQEFEGHVVKDHDADIQDVSLPLFDDYILTWSGWFWDTFRDVSIRKIPFKAWIHLKNNAIPPCGYLVDYIKLFIKHEGDRSDWQQCEIRCRDVKIDTHIETSAPKTVTREIIRTTNLLNNGSSSVLNDSIPIDNIGNANDISALLSGVALPKKLYTSFNNPSITVYHILKINLRLRISEEGPLQKDKKFKLQTRIEVLPSSD